VELKITIRYGRRGLRNTLDPKFVKRANGMPSRFRKMRKWTLWEVGLLRSGIETAYGVRA
jgi:hypothetical protein